MNAFPRSRARTGRVAVLAGMAAVAVVLPLGVVGGAAAAPRDDDPMDSLTAVPRVKGRILQTDESYLFSTMEKARVPLDLADYGYEEEEYFLSGTANVYDEDDAGNLQVITEDVEYVNRIIVRRPAKPRDASGVVLVDILNASNGYDIEDLWRRHWEQTMARGDTYIGITSKPVNVDALKNFDPERYEDLTWDSPTALPPLGLDAAGFDPTGTEEGLAWDIITQVGNVLDSQHARRILGGAKAETVILTGQSQSALYLNTYALNFHEAVTAANGGEPVFDGYLSVGGGVQEKVLRQGVRGDRSLGPAFQLVDTVEKDLGVPFVVVTSEGDEFLFDRYVFGTMDLPDTWRHYQVPGAPHTNKLATVVPDNTELIKAGRTPRDLDALPDNLSLYPLEQTVLASIDALVAWIEDGVPAPESVWFETDADLELVRDERGNALGGIRYGLIEYPLARFQGGDPADPTHGLMFPITLEEFRATYGTRAAYLALIEESNDELIAQGYLNELGARYVVDVANQLLDRIGA
ncbi:alpha/beta hydrolase domain-containing protein [Cellulomonas fimi]|uniref:Alpha/beta hydrolase domain-containing protein n=1 Tax=Cellulomonas fimi TaxID=1708 RepID=A0A7Y0LXD1_CELFI|nr:alpha/beta hydrolase domain-containing protein [Cellulomonas fimi]NMR19991.1 hypothetical protein [Cellulomonas fimi]